MTDEYHRTISDSMNQKETEELVEIWEKHDPDEWTKEAYEVIEEILQKRLGQLPAVDEGESDDDNDEIDEAEADEEDEDQPVFYDPDRVLKLVKWIDYAIYISIASVTLTNIFQFDTYQSLVKSYLYNGVNSDLLILLVTIVFFLFSLAFEFVIIYFPFKGLKRILLILMEMEFNSRLL
jgi:hypothetical protein